MRGATTLSFAQMSSSAPVQPQLAPNFAIQTACCPLRPCFASTCDKSRQTFPLPASLFQTTSFCLCTLTSVTLPAHVCAMPLTAFSHGQIWVHQPGGSATMDVDGRPMPGTLLPVAHGPVYFDPFVLHGSSKWQGDRLILLAFSVAVSSDMCPELLRRGFCPAHASRPASLELCAGSAGLSASLHEAGFDAIAVDLPTCEHHPRHSRVALDLTCAVLHFVETSPSLVYIHAGLPCGTCSRASANSPQGCEASTVHRRRSVMPSSRC